MTLDKRIYCIEGVFDYGNREVEPSVEPLPKCCADKVCGTM